MVVISFLSLIIVVCRIFIRGFWWGLGLGVITLNAYGSLTGYDFPSTTLASYSSSSPASASAASTTTTFAQWHRRLGHLSGSRLSTLVGSGVLGLVSGDVALHWVVSLANSYSSPILLVTLFRSTLLISFTLMYGVMLLLSQKGVIPTMSYLLMIIRDLPGSILCPLVVSLCPFTSSLPL